MIHYSTEGIEMPQFDTAQVEKWIRRVAAGYGFSIGEIHYIFCSDERILEVNKQYLGHDYYTDHIGFDYTTGHTLNGDIYISLETVATNAELYDKENAVATHTANDDTASDATGEANDDTASDATGKTKDIAQLREFYRVLIHAILHLTGQSDKTPEDEAEMHRKEDIALRS